VCLADGVGHAPDPSEVDRAMSYTFTQHVNPVVEQWLGKPILLAHAERCDICGTPSTDLKPQTGWSYGMGEALDVSLCPVCRGEGDD
jgi:hypothetical protein